MRVDPVSPQHSVMTRHWSAYLAAVLLATYSLFASACGESRVANEGGGGATIGVFRGGQWLVDLNGNGVWDGETVDRAFTFGSAGDVPVVGDWNGSGTLGISVFRAGQWLLDLNGNRAWDGATGGDRQIGFGQAGDLPVVGRWDGGPTSRVGIFRNGTWLLDVNGNGVWDGPGIMQHVQRMTEVYHHWLVFSCAIQPCKQFPWSDALHAQ